MKSKSYLSLDTYDTVNENNEFGQSMKIMSLVRAVYGLQDGLAIFSFTGGSINSPLVQGFRLVSYVLVAMLFAILWQVSSGLL